jgi:hypothetical protein
LATTASRALLVLLLAGCSGGNGENGGDPCTTRLELTLADVLIDGTASTTSPPVAFSLGIENPSSTDAHFLGYVLECRYTSPDSTFLRGSGSHDLAIPAGESEALEVANCLPGVVDWRGSPTGDGLTCTVEAIYELEGCTPMPPRATITVRGSDDITVLQP